MVSLLLAATLMGAGGDAPLSVGIDATEVMPTFFGKGPEIDPRYLVLAPTSSEVAVVASLATTLTGMFLLTGTVVLLSIDPLLSPLQGLSALGVGLVLLNFGPSVGDLMNGDVSRFLLHGLARAGAIAVSLIFPPTMFAWMAFIAWDIVNSRKAPARWVERHAPPPPPQQPPRLPPPPPPPPSPSPSTPGAGPGAQPLLRLAF